MSPRSVFETLARTTLVRGYLRAFRQATDVSVELMPSSELAHFFSRRRQNPFCSLIAQLPSACGACQHVHEQLQQNVTKSLAIETIRCFAGLAEFAVPLLIRGEPVATLAGGQLFERKPSQAQVARLRRQVRSWGIQQELPQIENAYLQTRVVPHKQFQASLLLLTFFRTFLANNFDPDLLKSAPPGERCITSAKDYVLAHASEPLHLPDVAQQVHLSTHYFSKLFKRTVGMGFSEFLAHARVENAKGLIANSESSMSRVSNEAGFGSLSQFNWAFHRFVGCSPKDYRASPTQLSP